MQLMNLVLKITKGLNNLLSPYKLNQKIDFIGRTANTEPFLTEADNIDITNDGGFRLRPGYLRKVSGNTHSLWSNGDVCYYRVGQYLKELNEDFSTTTILSGLSTQRLHMDFLHLLNGQTLFSDMKDNGIIDKGVARSWGLDVPSKPTPSITTGKMKAGTYLISLTYVRNDGQYSGACQYVVATIEANKGIALSDIPTSSDSTVSSVCIWITSPNGDALYPHKVIDNGTSSYTIKNNKLISDFPLSLKGFTKMPTGDMLEFHMGKIYIVKNSNIFYSEDFNYELHDPQHNYIAFTSPVTMISAANDGLWIGTEDAIYFAPGKPPFSDFIQKASYGAIKYTHKKIPGSFVGKGVDEEVTICNSGNGICICQDGGKFENLTSDTYAMKKSKVGVSLFRQYRGINQFVTSIIEGTESERIYK